MLTFAGPGAERARAELAATGVVRAGINLGNPVIVQQGPDGDLRGVGPALARELANRIGVRVAFITYDSAGKLAADVDSWDVAFLAIDPERAADIAFTAAYVHIEGTYLVPAGASIRKVDDVDRPGIRVAVGSKTAYELHLSRHLRNAELVREPTSQAALDRFLSANLDAVAGVRQSLVAAARAHPGHRVLDDSFMVIRQAAGVPKQQTTAHHYVAAFIEEAKVSGFVARALRESGVEGATIAPPA